MTTNFSGPVNSEDGFELDGTDMGLCISAQNLRFDDLAGGGSQTLYIRCPGTYKMQVLGVMATYGSVTNESDTSVSVGTGSGGLAATICAATALSTGTYTQFTVKSTAPETAIIRIALSSSVNGAATDVHFSVFYRIVAG